MKMTTRFAVAALLSIPLVAGAQTSTSGTTTSGSGAAGGVMPADQPRSNMEKQQTQQNGQALKYGQSGSNDQGASTSSSTGDGTSSGMHKSTTSQKSMGTSTNKSPDTSKSGMSNQTNTVDPTTTK